MFFLYCNLLQLTLVEGLQGRPQDLRGGGGQEFFFQIWEFACCEAMRIARGVRGHAPPRNFFKTMQFGAF